MQLRDLLSKGGFRLTKWLRNNSKVLNFILHEERAPSLLDLDLDKDKPPIQRALGLHWNMETDMFTFKVNLKEKPNTHKGILSLTSSLYNPLGLIAPIKEELDIPVTNSTFWSDSTCLLQHIKTHLWQIGCPLFTNFRPLTSGDMYLLSSTQQMKLIEVLR